MKLMDGWLVCVSNFTPREGFWQMTMSKNRINMQSRGLDGYGERVEGKTCAEINWLKDLAQGYVSQLILRIGCLLREAFLNYSGDVLFLTAYSNIAREKHCNFGENDCAFASRSSILTLSCTT